jgi:hypothetical protein
MHIIEALRASIAGVIRAIVFQNVQIVSPKTNKKKGTSRDFHFTRMNGRCNFSF